MKISAKFRKKAEVYLYFCPTLYKDGDINQPYNIEIKPDDLLKQYIFESYGPKKYQELFGDLSRQLSNDKYGNPYSIGKAWKEWHITNWIEDFNSQFRMLFIEDLYEDYSNNINIMKMIEESIFPNIK